MARSALGKIYQGSAQPALQNTANFVDQAIMQPESMMRTPEERLMFHVRENQQLADQGLIGRENLMAKAYADAGQADNIIQGDIYDAYARRRMDPSLQQELSLSRAGLPKEFIRGVSETGKRVVRDGKYDKTYQDYLTTNPRETVVSDPNLGGLPTVNYGRGYGQSSSLIKKEMTPEAKARLKSGTESRKFVKLPRNTIATNEQVLSTKLGLVNDYFDAAGYKPNVKNMINTLVSKAAAENMSLDDAILSIQNRGINIDAAGAEAIAMTMNDYDNLFEDKVTLNTSGNPAISNMRREANNLADPFEMGGEFTRGATSTVELPIYVGRDNRRYYEVPTNQGNVMMEADFVNNHKEEMKRNYAATINKPSQDLFKLEPESMSVIRGEKSDYTKPEDFDAKDDEDTNGMFNYLNNAYMSDATYRTGAWKKDKEATATILNQYRHKDVDDDTGYVSYGDYNVSHPKVLASLEALGFDPDADASPEETARLEQALLKQSHPTTFVNKGNGEYDVSINTYRARYLQEKNRGGLNRAGMKQEVTDVANDTQLAIATPQGESIDIPVHALFRNGKAQMLAKGANGEIITVEGDQNEDKHTAKNLIIQLGDKVNESLQQQGVVPEGSRVGQAKLLNRVPIGGRK